MRFVASCSFAMVVASCLFLAGCKHQNSSNGNSPVSSTQPGIMQPNQRTFDSPQEAAAVLKDAVDSRDRHALVDIFGEEGRQLIFTGDKVQEQNNMTAFADHLAEYLRVDQESPDKAVMYIGQNNWPFPIPIVKGPNGWFFDTAAGKDEILNRVIGKNELNAISVCREFVAAEKEYARKDRTGEGVAQYAQHFMSSDGKHDGLYWPAGQDEELSPMGELVAEAQMEGYLTQPSNGKRHPYEGYFFHILKAQGDAAPGGKMDYVVDGKMTKGFAMVAWPDKWGSSGIMTFVVNQDGKVYQKNLGQDTANVVAQMTEYNPDSTWEEVKE